MYHHLHLGNIIVRYIYEPVIYDVTSPVTQDFGYMDHVMKGPGLGPGPLPGAWGRSLARWHKDRALDSMADVSGAVLSD
jgi:hypothetical protein